MVLQHSQVLASANFPKVNPTVAAQPFRSLAGLDQGQDTTVRRDAGGRPKFEVTPMFAGQSEAASGLREVPHLHLVFAANGDRDAGLGGKCDEVPRVVERVGEEALADSIKLNHTVATAKDEAVPIR